MSKQSNIPELLERLDKFTIAAKLARGRSADLVKAAPLEIHLYNIATSALNELEGFRAMIEDFDGTYLSGPAKACGVAEK